MYVARINCRTASAVCPSLFTVPPGEGGDSLFLSHNPLPHPLGLFAPAYLVFGETNHRGHLPSTFRICWAAKRIAIQGCFSFSACLTNCVCSLTKKQRSGEKESSKRMGHKKGVVRASLWLAWSLNAFWCGDIKSGVGWVFD
ncbi:hypothetical protein CEXT_95171 [Caerostris extrusa]|uniref:Uncharacterized protein n=1 Tax=Caerostris extrusa TaxID=172846 RepID=A0AAV4PGP6_CAEEX|nr:hypothetical protein CEXT_95171 [Caerostris extrusa]